jgi:hypothetical protein
LADLIHVPRWQTAAPRRFQISPHPPYLLFRPLSAFLLTYISKQFSPAVVFIATMASVARFHQLIAKNAKVFK